LWPDAGPPENRSAKVAQAGLEHEAASDGRAADVRPTDDVDAADAPRRDTPETSAEAVTPSRVQPAPVRFDLPEEPAADLGLPVDRPIELAQARLRPGQRLGPRRNEPSASPEGPPARATVHVPRTGLVITVTETPGSLQSPALVEDVDFVWDHAPTADTFLVELHAESVAFRGCTFRGHRRSSTRDLAPVALRWRGPRTTLPDSAAGESAAEHEALSLPSGWLRLEDCSFHDVGAVVEVLAGGARRIEGDNLLHVGPGPLVCVDHPPRADEPMVIDLGRVTLRGAMALWYCAEPDRTAHPGPLSIRADHSVFVPASGGALMLFGARVGETSGKEDLPPPLLRALENVRWTGEGSLVAEETPIVARLRPDGTSESLDDRPVSIAGLVRSRVEFATPLETASEPDGHRLLRYQAPLRSTDPPGIDLERLP
jgi:hypothetical protein